MISVASFTFNPFQENTYLLYDDNKHCAIIDPGCYDENERKMLLQFIENRELVVKHIVNTHCHIDHVFGNRFFCSHFNLPLTLHKGEIPVLNSVAMVAQMYGLQVDKQPTDFVFLAEGDTLKIGDTAFEVLFTPGHSPASISLYSAADALVIAGDVLFQGSIGRTDLPGGDFDTLAASIRQNLYVLPDNTRVYPGHGAATTIGIEKTSNPFVQV